MIRLPLDQDIQQLNTIQSNLTFIILQHFKLIIEHLRQSSLFIFFILKNHLQKTSLPFADEETLLRDKIKIIMKFWLIRSKTQILTTSIQEKNHKDWVSQDNNQNNGPQNQANKPKISKDSKGIEQHTNLCLYYHVDYNERNQSMIFMSIQLLSTKYRFCILKTMKEVSNLTKDQEDFPIKTTSKGKRKQKLTKNKIYKYKIRFWSQDQNAYFLLFWLHQIVSNPLKTYSFDAPLKRNSFFKHLSVFITKSLGKDHLKTHQQCKSKFSTIKRQIQSEKQDNRLPPSYDFIDYIMDQVAAMRPRRLELTTKVNGLKHRMEKGSQFMDITKQLLLLERSGAVEEKNSSIMRYLQLAGEIKN